MLERRRRCDVSFMTYYERLPKDIGEVIKMSFNFRMPTEIVSGVDVIKNNCDKLILGKKCFIVCGRNSAKACGALDDVTAEFDKVGVKYEVFNKMMENPLMSVCYEGGRAAESFGADFIVAIGGGSPMDGAKAIAAYAANPEVARDDIFTADIKKSLPIVAIPTTAGTGSEVNSYSILTIDEKNVKKTFKSVHSYPKFALLDPKYTETLGYDYTVSTALDAFCHCIESYLSPNATEISRAFAVIGGRKIYSALKELEKIGKGDDALEKMKPLRYELLTGACAGGIAINTAGTGFNHPLGYNLTLNNNIPHGRACGVFMEEYVSFNLKTELGRKLLSEFCGAVSSDSPEKVAENIVKWSAVDVTLTEDEISCYIENVAGAANYANSPYVINRDEMREIYKRLFS